MTEDQSFLAVIRDYWVQISFAAGTIAALANAKFNIGKNSADIKELKEKADKLESKIEVKLEQQSQDIKTILIMLGDIKRNG